MGFGGPSSLNGDVPSLLDDVVIYRQQIWIYNFHTLFTVL